MTDIKKQIDRDVKNTKVLLYMKGTPDSPQCGFSPQTVTILKTYKIPIVTKNVLESDELRQALKEYSDWPVFPQLYVNGKFIGGCDIVTEMHHNGALTKLFEKIIE
jgi:monothiol glutaredoxin